MSFTRTDIVSSRLGPATVPGIPPRPTLSWHSLQVYHVATLRPSKKSIFLQTGSSLLLACFAADRVRWANFLSSLLIGNWMPYVSVLQHYLFICEHADFLLEKRHPRHFRSKIMRLMEPELLHNLRRCRARKKSIL